MVTANQLHVSGSNRPSSGCTFKEKGCTIYIVTSISSSDRSHIVYCTALIIEEKGIKYSTLILI